MRWRALLLLTALIAPAASADVKMEVQADGRKVFTNDDSPAVRRAPSLGRPLPLASVEPMVATYAERYELDPRLVHAVIRAESGYNPHARSRKGAMGLMQLMPATAEELRVADPYDPASNIAGGTRYLRALLDRFDGSLELALAGYNAGPEAVNRFGGVPPFAETRQYLERVLRDYRGEATYEAPAAAVRRGRPVRLVRDAYGRPILTTSSGG